MAKPRDPDNLRRRGSDNDGKGKEFERKVANLFALQGYRTTVDYKRDDMQFDIRLELTLGVLPIRVLVECKDVGDGTTQKDVREFASKVEYAYVFGPPEALEWVRFGDGWALYDVTDVPERVSEERVLAALRPKTP